MIIQRFLSHCLRISTAISPAKSLGRYILQQIKVTLLAIMGMSASMGVVLAVLIVLQMTGITPQLVYPWTLKILGSIALICPLIALTVSLIDLLFRTFAEPKRDRGD